MREFKSISSDLNEQVPTDWEVTKLNLVANLRRGPFGGALKVDSFVPEGYAVYEQQHAIHKKLSNIRYFINENKYKEMLTFKVEVNDILLSCSGTIGESVVIPTDYKEGIINQALLRIRLFRADLNINYFKYYMDSFLFQTLITDNSHGSAMKNIASMNVINKIPVPVPTKNEQEKIVLVLDSKLKVLDKTIEMKYKMLELLEKQRQSIITEAVTKGLNPNVKMKDSGVEWIGEIPEHWKVKPLYSLYNENKLKNKGNENKNVLSLSYGKIKRRDVESNYGLLPDSFETYQILKKGDIILRLTDLQNDKRSLRVGLVNEDGIITNAYLGLKQSNKSTSQYTYYLLHSYDLMKVFYGLGSGVRQSIGYTEMKKLPILLPPLEEQLEIIEFLKVKVPENESVIELLKKQIEKLKEYRQSLIYEAVTGKIDVRDMELD